MWPHELKLERARKHLEELEAHIDRWVNENGCAIQVTPDPEPPAYLISVEFLRPPDEDNSLSLLIGDVLQNLRSALEYLAYTLAEAGSVARGTPLTDWEVENSSFPIIGDVDSEGFSGRGPDMFRSAAPQKLAAVTPEARAVIERLQPFYDAPVWESHFLWVLNELARLDRHRFLHVAVARTGGLRLDPARTRNVKVRGQLEVLDPGNYFPEIENRADLGRITALKANPQEKMEMHFTEAVDLAFYSPDDVPIVDGEDVAHTLSLILARVSLAFHKFKPHLPR